MSYNFIISKHDVINKSEQFNNSPFNIESFIAQNDSSRLADEYRFYILSLNEYLTTRDVKIVQEKILSLIAEWVYERMINNHQSHLLSTLINEVKREYIFICGFWASQVLLSAEQKQSIIKTVSKEINLALKELKIIETGVKKSAGLSENASHKELLVAWKNYLELTNSHLKYLQSNKGKPAIVYYIIQLKSMEVFELTKIPKKEILIFLSELFYTFEFINKRERLSFPDNLYRNLNRVAKIEAIENLKTLSNRLLSF